MTELTIVDRIDPIQQIQVWLQQYCMAYSRPWAIQYPAHSICYSVCRMIFESDRTLEDLETILKRLNAEKQYPKSNYRWFIPVVKSAIEDEDAAKASRPIN